MRKKNLFMDSLDTKCHWRMVSCCPKLWLSLLRYLNMYMWVLERIEICHVYWEEKMSQIWNTSVFQFLFPLQNQGCIVFIKDIWWGTATQVLPQQAKYTFSSQGDWANRSVPALVKLSLKTKVVWRRNVTLCPVDPWETSFRFYLWLWTNLLGLAC